MIVVLRQFLLALVAFAIVGGTTAQLARPAQHIVPMTMAGMPCDMMMPTAGAGHGKPMMPCNGMTPDCVKQMCCVVDTALPVRLAGHEINVRSNTVDYWTVRSKWAELVREPEHLPPRTT